MLLIIKILQGAECQVEASSDSTLIYVKELVFQQLNIPVEQQRLVFKGKTLPDDTCLTDHKITDGSKLHLFVSNATTISQPPKPTMQEDVFWESLNKFLRKHYQPTDVIRIIEEFKKSLDFGVNSLSLDDIERLAKLKLEQRIA